jgi:hypothetical protein
LTIYLGVVAVFSLTATIAPDTAPVCLAILACIYLGLMLMTSEAGVRAVPVKITRQD